MRKILTSFAVVAGLVLATAAFAQGTGSSSGGQGSVSTGTGNASSSTMTTEAAPVGHRQPRANEVPDEKNDITAIDPRDAALDRALRSICRGC